MDKHNKNETPNKTEKHKIEKSQASKVNSHHALLLLVLLEKRVEQLEAPLSRANDVALLQALHRGLGCIIVHSHIHGLGAHG